MVRCPLPWLSAEALELQQKLEEEATRYAKEHFCAPRDFVEGSASELPCPKDAAQVRWAVTKEARVEVAEEQVEQAMIDGQGKDEEDEGDEVLETPAEGDDREEEQEAQCM